MLASIIKELCFQTASYRPNSEVSLSHVSKYHPEHTRVDNFHSFRLIFAFFLSNLLLDFANLEHGQSALELARAMRITAEERTAIAAARFWRR